MLLIGLSIDQHLDLVEAELTRRGRDVRRVDTDIDLAMGACLELRPPAPSCTTRSVLCRTTELGRPMAFHAAETFVTVDPYDGAGPWADHARREAAAAATAWIAAVEAARWIDRPTTVREADVASTQLTAAARAGLAVPQTLITGDARAARSFVATCGEVVSKVLDHPEAWRDGDEAGFAHTELIEADDLVEAFPTPMLLQERLRPRVEHRVTVVGTQVFTASVSRAADSVDWRRDLPAGVEFRRTELDPEIAGQVVAAVQGLGLRFAAVDLLEDEDGRTWFLEVNPTGAYGWLERSLGLPITSALVDLLEEGWAR